MKRIEPRDDGVELSPPGGGSWLRDPDGGLTPADQQTAEAAGLEWAEPAAPAKPTKSKE